MKDEGIEWNRIKRKKEKKLYLPGSDKTIKYIYIKG